MFDRELAHREFEVVEDWFASLADGGRELSLLLVAQEKARAALARAQDDAAMEARAPCRRPTRRSLWGRKHVPFGLGPYDEPRGMHMPSIPRR